MRILLAGMALVLALSGTSATGGPTIPSIDKQKLEVYLRYAEGFASSVKFAIDDPQPSPFPGYYRLMVHLSTSDSKLDKLYYLTADGKTVITGPIWNLNAYPFAETLEHLSTTGPSFGPLDAKVSIVIFSDFECPYCREFARTVRDNVPQKYPKDVRVVFKDFPIDSLHPWASAAAEVSHCIGEQKPDAFWSFHDWIFQHQGEVNPGNLREKALAFAKEQGLDSAKVASCLDTHATRAEVEQSLKEGRMLGVQQTPTFFVNGRTVPGSVSWATLNTLIQMELTRPASIPAPPANACCQLPALPRLIR